ncbi:hypothetical protein Ancab_011470 [Ancistrocladus abbreviatus]
MADLRMEDNLSHLLTEKDGSMAGKTTKSLTPVEESTNAEEKVLLHVPRCSSSGHFSTNVEAVQSRSFADLPSPATLQSVLGLSASLDQEVLDPQHEGNMNEDMEALKKLKKGSRKLNKMEGKVMCFNEEDADGVRLGESVSDLQFLNRNHVICIGNEKSIEAGTNLQPE